MIYASDHLFEDLNMLMHDVMGESNERNCFER